MGLLAAAAWMATAISTNAGSAWLTSATYNGLFYETNGNWQQSAGMAAISTTAKGSYSVKITLGTASYSCSGAFGTNSTISRDIVRHHDSSLHVQVSISPEDPDLITGTISTEDWTATLFADRAIYDGHARVCPDAGQYTMVIPGDPTSSSTPGGDSYGTITISKTGRLSFSGWLADGNKMSQSTTVSKNGDWPLYVSLYRSYGTLYSWMLFNNSTNDQLSGQVIWIKPQQYWDWYYPQGFNLSLAATGSFYVRPASHAKVLDLSDASLSFNGGNLHRAFTNRVTLDDRNHVINQSDNRLTITISLSNGSFTGKVLDPNTWEWTTFQGVVLQNQNVAVGCFPGWDQSGEVRLESGW